MRRAGRFYLENFLLDGKGRRQTNLFLSKRFFLAIVRSTLTYIRHRLQLPAPDERSTMRAMYAAVTIIAETRPLAEIDVDETTNTTTTIAGVKRPTKQRRIAAEFAFDADEEVRALWNADATYLDVRPTRRLHTLRSPLIADFDATLGTKTINEGVASFAQTLGGNFAAEQFTSMQI